MIQPNNYHRRPHLYGNRIIPIHLRDPAINNPRIPKRRRWRCQPDTAFRGAAIKSPTRREFHQEMLLRPTTGAPFDCLESKGNIVRDVALVRGGEGGHEAA
jgi:hypothetical protein